MMGSSLDTLRKQLDEVNLEILELINRRAEIVQQIGQIKSKQSMKKFDPVREREMLDLIT
ncbi:MAG TPA: chorismate mutase, partial [Bacillota bacterium]|nr:chorismate mutase [Bacillota bacterium]